MSLLTNIVLAFHIALTVAYSSYFLWGSPYMDKLFLLSFFILNLSWVILKNECLTNYVFKKLQDPTYTIGKDVDWTDLEYVVDKKTSGIILIIIKILFLANFLFATYRLHLDFTTNIFIGLFMLSHLLYFKYADTMRIPHGILSAVAFGLVAIA